MSKGERIRKLRVRLGLSQVELADRIDVSKQTLYKYENDIITNIPSDKIEAIARETNSTPAYIMGWNDDAAYYRYDNIDPIGTQSLPVLGAVACGEPVFMTGQIDFYVKNTTGVKADFVLTARGDSMTGARIYDGDLVFVRKQDQVDNGEIAAVAIGDEATLKRVYYYRDKNLLILKPENPQFEDMIYSGSELDEVHILGKAVAFQSDVR